MSDIVNKFKIESASVMREKSLQRSRQIEKEIVKVAESVAAALFENVLQKTEEGLTYSDQYFIDELYCNQTSLSVWSKDEAIFNFSRKTEYQDTIAEIFTDKGYDVILSDDDNNYKLYNGDWGTRISIQLKWDETASGKCNRY